MSSDRWLFSSAFLTHFFKFINCTIIKIANSSVNRADFAISANVEFGSPTDLRTLARSFNGSSPQPTPTDSPEHPEDARLIFQPPGPPHTCHLLANSGNHTPSPPLRKLILQDFHTTKHTLARALDGKLRFNTSIATCSQHSTQVAIPVEVCCPSSFTSPSRRPEPIGKDNTYHHYLFPPNVPHTPPASCRFFVAPSHDRTQTFP